jgi:hypothetical protein
LSNIDSVLCKNNWIVVGKGDGTTAQTFSRPGDPFRRSNFRQFIPYARLANVPVLTESAAEVAAGSPKREHSGPREEMVQWLFLNWINTKSTTTAISRQNYPVTDALTHETETALALV